MKFQIGPDKHQYIYTETDMAVNGATVYKCRRGQDGGTDHVLFLARAQDGRWIAREAYKDSLQPVLEGKKIFMTQEEIVDITNEGDFKWMMYDAAKATWYNLKYPFRTKVIEY